jgi:hypothetical protein
VRSGTLVVKERVQQGQLWYTGSEIFTVRKYDQSGEGATLNAAKGGCDAFEEEFAEGVDSFIPIFLLRVS